MSKFEELTYYELLEIPPNASTFEIRQAYKEALSIYGSDSPISYSFFIEEERERILENIENAFATLIDAQKPAILASTAHSLKFQNFQNMYFEDRFPEEYRRKSRKFS